MYRRQLSPCTASASTVPPGQPWYVVERVSPQLAASLDSHDVGPKASSTPVTLWWRVNQQEPAGPLDTCYCYSTHTPTGSCHSQQPCSELKITKPTTLSRTGSHGFASATGRPRHCPVSRKTVTAVPCTPRHLGVNRQTCSTDCSQGIQAGTACLAIPPAGRNHCGYTRCHQPIQLHHTFDIDVATLCVYIHPTAVCHTVRTI